MGSKQAHVCMEATGRHSLGVALALHDAGHVVSVGQPGSDLVGNSKRKGYVHPFLGMMLCHCIDKHSVVNGPWLTRQRQDALRK
jgi:hypothetical protein